MSLHFPDKGQGENSQTKSLYFNLPQSNYPSTLPEAGAETEASARRVGSGDLGVVSLLHLPSAYGWVA